VTFVVVRYRPGTARLHTPRRRQGLASYAGILSFS
jgi:hypothetical protein